MTKPTATEELHYAMAFMWGEPKFLVPHSLRAVPPQNVTAAELRVLLHIVQGASDKDIATQLKVTPKTVKKHTSSILKKTGAVRRTALVSRYAPLKPPDAKPHRPFTEREREVLKHVAAGLTMPKVAEALSIETGTVRNRIRHMMEATGTHSCAELVLSASPDLRPPPHTPPAPKRAL